MTGWFTENMPEAEYHGMIDRLSATGVKAILRSPAHFRQDRDHGREPKDSFDLGSAAHTLTLGVGYDLAVWDGPTWQGKEATEFKEQARAENMIPIKAADYQRAYEVALRLRRHPVAGPWFQLGKGISELSLFWQDEETGIDCRARLDRLTLTDDGRPLIVDLKTCQDASPHGIQSHVAKFRYYVQQPFYQAGLIGSGLDPDGVGEFRFVFAELHPPFPVTIVRLTGTAVWQGQQEVRKAMQIYAECMETGKWPEYAEEEIEIDLPKWKYYEQQYQGGAPDAY